MGEYSFIYLASQSPRRKQLLEQIGVAFELLLPNVDNDILEDTEALESVLPAENPTHYVQRVTYLKLDAAIARVNRRNLPSAPILCSDTTVALNGRILGKPSNRHHAAQMLEDLSGQTHQVLTSVAIQTPKGQRLTALSRSDVRFAVWSSEKIAAYVASGESDDKAGAYAIQGRASFEIEHISGSYTGIIGLPVFETVRLLKEIGFKF